MGTIDHTSINNPVAECVSLNESDLALHTAVPGRSQRDKRKRKAGGKGADSAGMVSRNRSGQMMILISRGSAGGDAGGSEQCTRLRTLDESYTVDTLWINSDS